MTANPNEPANDAEPEAPPAEGTQTGTRGASAKPAPESRSADPGGNQQN